MRILSICVLVLLVSCAPRHRSAPPQQPAEPTPTSQPAEPPPTEPVPTSQPASNTYWVDPLQFKDGSAADRAAMSWTALRRRQDVEPGDTVIFRSGKYARSMVIEAEGTPTAPITFRAEQPLGAVFLDRVKLHGKHLRLEGFAISSVEGYGVYIRGEGNHASKCRITATGQSGVFVNGVGAVVSECEIRFPGVNGVAVAESVDTLIVDNSIEDVRRSGIFVYDDAHGVTIRGNRIHRAVEQTDDGSPDGHGIYAKGTSSGRIVIEDNDFIGTHFHQCISLRGPGIIRRNVIRGAGNTRNGIFLLDDTGRNPNAYVLVENNLVYDVGMGALRIGKTCRNWTIEVRNNTLVGTTVGILLGGHEQTMVSFDNNIVGVTGPGKESRRPECDARGFVVRRFGEFEALRFGRNLLFNRLVDQAWTNLPDLGDVTFGDPGFSATVTGPDDFRVREGGAGAVLVIDRGLAIDGLDHDLRKSPRRGKPDLGAFEN